MKKLAIFFRTFKKSISSFTYYRDVAKAPFTFSFKYFWAFSLFLGLILTVLTSIAVVPPLTNFLTRFQTRAHSLYPASVVITVKSGEVSTNTVEPLRFPMPYELFTDTPPAVSDQKQTYLVTIDTHATTADFEKSQSLALVTKNQIILRDDNGGFRVYPIEKDTNITLNHDTVEVMLTKVLPALKVVVPLVIFFLFILFALLLPLSRLITLLATSIILLIASRLMNLPLSYRKLYQIGLHALTLPTLIQIVMTMWGLWIPIPFFNSLLYILYMLVILATLKESKPVPTKA